MPYAKIPKDLRNIKTKIIFNLTARQLICFSIAAAVGIPVYLLTRESLTTNISSLLLLITSLPFFLFAMYEKNGEGLEKVLWQYLKHSFLRPQIRHYKLKKHKGGIKTNDKEQKKTKY